MEQTNGIHKGLQQHLELDAFFVGDFAVNLRLFFWVGMPKNAWKTGFDLTEQIKKEFDRQNIEIPFPYRTIVYKKDLEKKKNNK